MTTRWVLVDGYSVLHAWRRFTTRKARSRHLAQRRDDLVRVLGQYADQARRRVTVVFDAYAARHKPEVLPEQHGIEVLYSASGKTADDTIERLVAAAPEPATILVVTSDHMERRTVEGLGAQSVAADLFEDEIDVTLRDLAAQVREHSRRRRLGGFDDELA